MVAALVFIMPATGALFTITLISVFLMRLILGEEAFLTAQIGEPYLLYRRAVPRLLPRLRPSLPKAADARIGCEPSWRNLRRSVCSYPGLPVVELRQPADGQSHLDFFRSFADCAGPVATDAKCAENRVISNCSHHSPTGLRRRRTASP